MKSVLDLNVGLFQHLANQEDGGGCAVANDVVLGGAGFGDHAGCRVLDLLQGVIQVISYAFMIEVNYSVIVN